MLHSLRSFEACFEFQVPHLKDRKRSRNVISGKQTIFLNQETPVAFGAEKFAVDLDIPVVFCHIDRIKRGYYEFEYHLIESEPKKTAYGEITKKFTKKLEDVIREDPIGWLWTHKRWKREKPVDMVVHSLEN